MTVILPGAAPREVGANVTFTVQVAPAVSEAPQLFVWANGGATLIAPKERAASPVLETVTDWPALAVPTTCGLNVKAAGDADITGAIPVPERATILQVSGLATLIVRFPDAAPLAVGENVTFIVQLAPAASEVPQLFV